jgi:hypothetical protein
VFDRRRSIGAGAARPLEQAPRPPGAWFGCIAILVGVIPAVSIIQPTLVSRPFHRAGWIYEEKVDGWRMVAYKDGAAVKLVSRQGRDHTRRFAAIAAAIQSMPASTLVLDGEVAVFDRALISRFEWLRHTAPPDHLEPRQRAPTAVGRLRVLRHQSLVAPLEPLLPRLQPVVGEAPDREQAVLKQGDYRVEERGWDPRNKS